MSERRLPVRLAGQVPRNRAESSPQAPLVPRGSPPKTLSLLALLAVTAAPLAAQVNSRAEEIQQARREKAANAAPEELSKAESRLNYIMDKHILERLATGFHGLTMVMGGLPTGQGFAIGPQYSRLDLAGGALKFRTSARGASARAVLIDLQATMPKLAGGKFFVDFLAQHRNLPRLEYFGPGPDSQLGDRSNFRLEDTSADFTVGYRPFEDKLSRLLSLGVTGGFLEVNTGPGNNSDLAQTADLFTPQTTPGIDDQTEYFRGGFFAQYDYRDNPLGPRSGGNYVAKFTYYNGDLRLHDFKTLHLEAQQYFPFLNKRRVIALRTMAILSYANANQTIPFYIQPVLGGSESLRGFRAYRFYDNNLILANAEYRWEAFSGLDMALFFDAGKVVPTRSQVNYHDLEGSAGIGFRFNVQNSVFLRIDVGFSHEGTNIWLKFENVF